MEPALKIEPFMRFERYQLGHGNDSGQKGPFELKPLLCKDLGSALMYGTEENQTTPLRLEGSQTYDH